MHVKQRRRRRQHQQAPQATFFANSHALFVPSDISLRNTLAGTGSQRIIFMYKMEQKEEEKTEANDDDDAVTERAWPERRTWRYNYSVVLCVCVSK